MSYKVVKTFVDLQDDNFKYEAGDTFPRLGLEVSKERLEELSGSKNRRHMPLIEEVVESPKAKETKEVKRKRTPKKKED